MTGLCMSTDMGDEKGDPEKREMSPKCKGPGAGCLQPSQQGGRVRGNELRKITQAVEAMPRMCFSF